MDRLKIIYVYDALCTWCYGFSPVITALFEKYEEQFDFEVLSGGTQSPNGGIPADQEQLQGLYKTVESITGITFGEAFLTHLEKGIMRFSSEKPAIALSVFKSFQPQNAVLFVREIQNSIYFDGKNPDHDELYRYLAVNHNIDPDEFIKKLNSEEYRQEASYDVALTKQLQTESFPSVFVQYGPTNFYLIAKGYTDYETLELRLENVLSEISGKN